MTIGKTCLQPQPLSIKSSAQYVSYFIPRAGLSAGGWTQGRERKRVRCCFTCRRERLSYCCYVETWVLQWWRWSSFWISNKIPETMHLRLRTEADESELLKSGLAARAAMITRLIGGEKMSCQLFLRYIVWVIFQTKVFHGIRWLQFL